jgi:hypothetical protein
LHCWPWRRSPSLLYLRMCRLVAGEAFHSRGVVSAQGTPKAIRDEDAVRFSCIRVESRRGRREGRRSRSWRPPSQHWLCTWSGGRQRWLTRPVGWRNDCQRHRVEDVWRLRSSSYWDPDAERWCPTARRVPASRWDPASRRSPTARTHRDAAGRCYPPVNKILHCSVECTAQRRNVEDAMARGFNPVVVHCGDKVVHNKFTLVQRHFLTVLPSLFVCSSSGESGWRERVLITC